MASPTALRRIQKEWKDIQANPLEGLTVTLAENDNLLVWNGVIAADSHSPYKGGFFKFILTFPENFPFKAPSVAFRTKIYHPGVNEEGHICVPMLHDQWKPSITLSSVLAIIVNKINNPSPDDPFEPDIAALMKNDEAKFLATAKEWTKKYGNPNQDSAEAH